MGHTTTTYRKTSNISHNKFQNLKCFSFRPAAFFAQFIEVRCWDESEDVVGAAPTCSDYIWVIDNFFAYLGAAYIMDFTVYDFLYNFAVFVFARTRIPTTVCGVGGGGGGGEGVGGGGRVMDDPQNSLSEEGLSAAIIKLLKNNENAVIVREYQLMHVLAVQSGYGNWGFLEDRLNRSFWAFPFPKRSPFLSAFNDM